MNQKDISLVCKQKHMLINGAPPYKFTDLYHFIIDLYHFITHLYHFVTHLYHFITDLYHYITDLYHFITDLYHFITNLYHFITDLYHFFQLNSRVFTTESVSKRHQFLVQGIISNFKDSMFPFNVHLLTLCCPILKNGKI